MRRWVPLYAGLLGFGVLGCVHTPIDLSAGPASLRMPRPGQDAKTFENSLTGAGKLIDAKGLPARYIRCYSKGSTDSALNSYIEVEAYGLPVK